MLGLKFLPVAILPFFFAGSSQYIISYFFLPLCGATRTLHCKDNQPVDAISG